MFSLGAKGLYPSTATSQSMSLSSWQHHVSGHLSAPTDSAAMRSFVHILLQSLVKLLEMVLCQQILSSPKVCSWPTPCHACRRSGSSVSGLNLHRLLGFTNLTNANVQRQKLNSLRHMKAKVCGTRDDSRIRIIKKHHYQTLMDNKYQSVHQTTNHKNKKTLQQPCSIVKPICVFFPTSYKT